MRTGLPVSLGDEQPLEDHLAEVLCFREARGVAAASRDAVSEPREKAGDRREREERVHCRALLADRIHRAVNQLPPDVQPREPLQLLSTSTPRRPGRQCLSQAEHVCMLVQCGGCCAGRGGRSGLRAESPDRVVAGDTCAAVRARMQRMHHRFKGAGADRSELNGRCIREHHAGTVA